MRAACRGRRQSIRNDLEWLGWKPVATTFSSESFLKLYEMAIKLIKVCFKLVREYFAVLVDRRELSWTLRLVHSQMHHRWVFFLQAGKAYICHQTKEDIARCREIARLNAANPGSSAGDPCSPWRDRPIEVRYRESQPQWLSWVVACVIGLADLQGCPYFFN